MAKLKLHIGKKSIKLEIRDAPLTTQAREVTKKSAMEITEILKLDDVEITEAKPYKIAPKQKEEVKEEIKEIDYEAAEKAFEEIDDIFKSFNL